MWANYYPDAGGFVCLHSTRTCAKDNAEEDCLNAAIPVAVIPLDNPEALVSRASYVVDNMICTANIGDICRAVLLSSGVLPKPRKGGRK